MPVAPFDPLDALIGVERDRTRNQWVGKIEPHPRKQEASKETQVHSSFAPGADSTPPFRGRSEEARMGEITRTSRVIPSQC
jgi:hypothetical protein